MVAPRGVILSVDDSIESILDWCKEEGMIFHGGSGAGLNRSRIRTFKELLSSGGNAFMAAAALPFFAG